MSKGTRFVGLEVQAATIAVAVAEPDGGVRALGIMPNEPDAVRRVVKRLGPAEHLRACDEAGPCGYTLYWQLTQLGVDCHVVAPPLVPVKAGDRVKTDRRDAARLARSFRRGDLTPGWVPDPAHEALRDLVRAREAAKKDERRARHRLQKFLLRQGHRPPAGTKAWTERHRRWMATLQFEYPAQEATRLDYLTEVEHARDRIVRLERSLDEAVETAPGAVRAVIEALQALRGIAKLAAVTIVAEVGRLSRFAHARRLMGYSGAVASEHSSGPRIRRGSICEDRKRASAPERHRGGLGLSSPAGDWVGPAAAARPGGRGGHGHRLEGPASASSAVSAAAGSRHDEAAGRDRRRSGTPRLHLGERGGGRVAASRAAGGIASSGTNPGERFMTPGGQRSRRPRNGESSMTPMRPATRWTRDTSPRQLPTDHDHDGEPCARSANISVSNRRRRCFDRCPSGVRSSDRGTGARRTI